MGRGVPAQIIEKWRLGRNVDRASFFLICKARRKKECCDFAYLLTFRFPRQLYISEFINISLDIYFFLPYNVQQTRLLYVIAGIFLPVLIHRMLLRAKRLFLSYRQ